jgi:predicted negative regulator of RcsB-dependent stress response
MTPSQWWNLSPWPLNGGVIFCTVLLLAVLIYWGFRYYEESQRQRKAGEEHEQGASRAQRKTAYHLFKLSNGKEVNLKMTNTLLKQIEQRRASEVPVPV